MQMTVFLQQRD